MQRTLAALGLLLAISGAAHAATLTTGILFGPRLTTQHGNGSTYCSITNVGSRDIQTTVRTLDSVGSPADVQSFLLPPGASRTTIASDVFYARCEFVFTGSARHVRASGCTAVGLEGCLALEVAR